MAGDGWIDISIPIRPRMPVFPGDPPITIELAQALAFGASCNVTPVSYTHLTLPTNREV